MPINVCRAVGVIPAGETNHFSSSCHLLCSFIICANQLSTVVLQNLCRVSLCHSCKSDMGYGYCLVFILRLLNILSTKFALFPCKVLTCSSGVIYGATQYFTHSNTHGAAIGHCVDHFSISRPLKYKAHIIMLCIL